MFKFIKKATSALLASIMCIPAGIVNVSHAVASNPDGSYTVTLTDTENGLIQFSESSMNNSTASQDGYQMMQIGDDGEMEQIENDGSLWAFKAGDDVEIECIPDEGYYVETLSLKDSETGKILSQTDTVDNVFSFEMPEKNISVEAVFSSTATINIKDDKKSKSSDEIEYHDIIEDMDISKEEVEEEVVDVITESYIKSNINEKYIKLGGKTSLVNCNISLHREDFLFRRGQLNLFFLFIHRNHMNLRSHGLLTVPAYFVENLHELNLDIHEFCHSTLSLIEFFGYIKQACFLFIDTAIHKLTIVIVPCNIIILHSISQILHHVIGISHIILAVFIQVIYHSIRNKL
ncbi:hypothetical protein IMSAGC013_03108 [Lachnospiraceae bacterium]|nr:hypothetical protein IMSAGC013_03108 [Lachnospiraceae bacterium]